MPQHASNAGHETVVATGWLLGVLLGAVLVMNLPAKAQAPPAADVAITLTDELVLAPGDARHDTALRDSLGALISRPGDVIRYTLTAANRGAQPANGVELVDRVPVGTVYVTGSATGSGATVTYSIDGGNYYQPTPVLIEVARPDGTIEKRAAPPERFTHIKWRLTEPIATNSSLSVAFSVRVTVPDTTGETRP